MLDAQKNISSNIVNEEVKKDEVKASTDEEKKPIKKEEKKIKSTSIFSKIKKIAFSKKTEIKILCPQDKLLEKVKKLRELTGVGFKDCKIAIDENNGDIEKSLSL